jgi:hypothetical protein
MRYTVKKTVETVLAQGCDLLVQVKDNQPSLATALRAVTLAHPARDTHRTEDVGRHNRMRLEQHGYGRSPLSTLTQTRHGVSVKH